MTRKTFATIYWGFFGSLAIAAILTITIQIIRVHPTVENGLYQGHALNCLFGVTPPDGFYDVYHGEDGTAGGEYVFYRDGRVVATCNLGRKPNDTIGGTEGI